MVAPQELENWLTDLVTHWNNYKRVVSMLSVRHDIGVTYPYEEALRLLRAGKTPEEALEQIKQANKGQRHMQFAINNLSRFIETGASAYPNNPLELVSLFEADMRRTAEESRKSRSAAYKRLEEQNDPVKRREEAQKERRAALAAELGIDKAKLERMARPSKS